MGEIWKSVTIEPYTKKCTVSNHGNVKGPRNKILLPCVRNGYLAISLACNNKAKTEFIHRLVALAFIEKKDEKLIVNHKNGNKFDNNVENLEWITYKENTRHAHETGLHKVGMMKVKQYTKDGEFVAEYDSIVKASKESGANDRHISCVCLGKRKTCGGFIWKYADDCKNTTRVQSKDVEGKLILNFPNYLVTRDGRVYSKRSKKYLEPNIVNRDYACVKLCNDNNRKDAYIHILVANAYLDKSRDICSVNHKNLNRMDNSVENLEWVSASENMRHAFKNGAMKHKNVYKYQDGKVIESFDSICNAVKETGISYYLLRKACETNTPIENYIYSYHHN